jgi:hypothetical protein
MSLSTIRNSEIVIDGIEGFGFHKAEKLTKAIIANILNVFFSKEAISFKTVLNDLSAYSNEESTSPLFILQEFPYMERKIPALIIELGDSSESPLYIGTDNLAANRAIGNSRLENIYTGGDDAQVSIGVLSESPDTTSNLADLVKMAYVNYFRWHYFFRGDDGSVFSIAPAMSKVKISTQFEVQEADMKMIFGRAVSFSVFTQYTFYDNLEASCGRYVLLNQVDPSSGPISVPFS